MTAIIILNWNGAQDTIECIDSICQIEDDYFCTIVDNGSEDDSVESIIQHLSRKGILHSIVERGGEQPSTVSNHEFIVYKNGVNMGFAKGNNEAIRLISKFRPDTYLLLNNDTIVEKDFLHSLTLFSKDHPEYKVLTPLIFYYYDKERIWNAGGKLSCGMRQYFYNNKRVGDIIEKGHIDSTFITGCAMYFTSDLLLDDGGIFTEDFFFGEEDFNFCIKMKKKGVKMACVLDSIIYHKVNASTKNIAMGKYYIHHLNRFIDIKKSYGWPFFILWSIPNSIYAALALIRATHDTIGVFKTLRDVNIEAWRKEKVTQEDFCNALKNK